MLIVDDDLDTIAAMRRGLLSTNIEVDVAIDCEQAIHQYQRRKPDLVIIDVLLGAESGLTLLRDLKAVDAGIPIVMLTGLPSWELSVRAMKLGAIDYVEKPLSISRVLEYLRETPGTTGGLIPPQAGTPPPALIPSLHAVWCSHIMSVLCCCGGNVANTARWLEIDRRTLQRLLQHPLIHHVAIARSPTVGLESLSVVAHQHIATTLKACGGDEQAAAILLEIHPRTLRRMLEKPGGVIRLRRPR